MEIPPLNHPVIVRSVDGTEYSSRSEGVEDGALVLATPFELAGGARSWEGREITVCWTSGSGLCELPLKIVGTALDGAVRVWHARLSSDAARTRHLNRRAHVRVPLSSQVTVEHEDTTYSGIMLDASEAGLRCRLGRVDLPEAGTVTASFTVGEDSFALPGIVYRVTAHDGSSEVVLALDADDRDATTLRRALFAEQIKQRQRQRLV
ncbi:PilZ domain-containing protein [Nocardioides nematodiphilus]|uniref:PilZ domain-containing protein n=1 Tax=Nocardioides nematodiphilus TaxID=2849669 RepID=UPI001CD94375|nr:PilZ domain-containing protein [Nocardioides nematodiphilus]MCA1984783.1 PilZ domain-containing protein [Nocardioides nematodiphilus]